jgi:hypothetical protein
MSYVPGFRNDVFLSYASGDNHQGAVEEFAKTLEKTVSDNLVNPAALPEKIRIYFDRDRLATQTAVNWERHLEEEASSSALLVPLLSPNYLSSEYCAKELEWFGAQSHVADGHPFAVAAWLPVGDNPVPGQFEKAQSHAFGSWLGLMSPEARLQSAREFALKLRDRLVEMRALALPVFLGPAAGRAKTTRSRLRDELEKSGHRVVPPADFVFRKAEAIHAHLKASLLAIHFLEEGLDIEPRKAIEESLRSAPKTILVQPFGSAPDEDDAEFLREIETPMGEGPAAARAAYTRLEGKTDDQVWDIVKREVRAARFRKNRGEFEVGVACEVRDLTGAKAVAGIIAQQGLPVQYPLFDSAAGTTEKLQALRATIMQSRALLCYWAHAEGKGLGRRLEQDARRGYKAKAWYLAPPLDLPAKGRLSHTAEMVLRQSAPDADLATLEPFLRELGWEPPAP